MILNYLLATVYFLVGIGLIIIGFLDRREGCVVAGAILLAAVYLRDDSKDDRSDAKPLV